jgi:hypothetical protein
MNQSQHRLAKLGVWSAAAMLMGLWLVGSADAATLTWNRNAEPDVKDYQVYACFTPNCIVTKSSAQLQPGGPILQTPAGTRPAYVIDLAGKEGALGVVVRDQSLNESSMSVPLPFDLLAPSPAAGLTLQ